MFRKILITTAALAGLLLATPNAQVPMAADVDMSVVLLDLDNGTCLLDISTNGEIGSATLLTFGFSYDEMMDGPGPIQFLLPAEFGTQRFQVTVQEQALMQFAPQGLHAPGEGVFARNFVLQHGKIVGSDVMNVFQAQGGATFEDFASLTPGQTGPLNVGLLQITATNNDGPDEILVFDSSAPTGGDGDLVTPGYHPSNQIPRGNIIVIAEDVEDSNPADGLVDDPDDDNDGGTIFVALATTVAFFQAECIDVDPEETWVARWYFGQNELGSIDIDIAGPQLKGDNAVFTLTIQGLLIDRVEFDFGSSGGITTIFYDPAGQ